MNKRGVAAAMICLAAGSASADVLYGLDLSDQTIFTLDTTNGAMQKYGGHPVNSFGGLDFDSQGNLFLQQFGSLYQIDLGVSSTSIGASNGKALESFEIIGDTGYAADVFDGGLYEINLSNNNANLIGFYGDDPSRVTGLASNESDTLYGVRYNLNDVIRIDPATGANLGTVGSGLSSNTTSLAYGSSNNLWYIPYGETTLYSMDIGTGQITPVLQGLNVGHVTGLTSNVVPTPGTGALLGFAGLAAARRRR